MSRSRNLRRTQMRKTVAAVPAELLHGIEELQACNQALHVFNQALIHVYVCAERMLNSRTDDLAPRVALGKALDHAAAIKAKLMEEAPPPQGEQNGPVGNT